MQPRSEEFLYFLLWSADILLRPTFRNLTDSYEAWAYRNGLFRQVAALEKRHLLERNPGLANERLYRLTEEGRLHALGGRDPQAQWKRPWDGLWRWILFDVPITQNTRRNRLRRYLRSRTFGCLQRSVWITPDPLEQERKILTGAEIDVASLIFLEGRPCAGEPNTEIVTRAWDFTQINARYAHHLKVLGDRPGESLNNKTIAKAFQRWATAEREAWLTAVSIDPLLPEALLPPDYLGQKAWSRRIEVLQQAAQQLQNFQP